jgi:hypothetical protein
MWLFVWKTLFQSTYSIVSYILLLDLIITCRDVTKRAKEIAQELPSSRRQDVSYGCTSNRVILRLPNSTPHPPTTTTLSDQTDDEASISLRTLQPVKSKSVARETHLITFRGIPVDLSGLEQLVHTSQSRFILETLLHLSESSRHTEGRPLKQLLHELDRAWDGEGGMEKRVSNGYGGEFTKGGFARVRVFELAGAINRIEGLSVECDV